MDCGSDGTPQSAAATFVGFFNKLLDSDFMPHAHCFLWNPETLWLHVISDGVIAASYFSIPIALVVLYKKRVDVQYSHVLSLFAAFIFLCGVTHVLGIWTMWDPIYRVEGVIKAATALVSVLVAIALWPLIPKILAIPNPKQLVDANHALRDEIERRRLADERFRLLLESAPDAMVIVNAEGVIEIVNERCESMFGYSRSELVGQAVEIFVPEAARDAHIAQRLGYVTEAEPKPMGAGRELFGLRSDGSEFPVEISLSPLSTPEGLLVSAAIRDISDRLAVQRQLQALNDALARRVDDRTAELARRADELARSNQELEQFAYVVSHDLKSPMRGISSLSEWLLEDQAERLDEEGREQLTLLNERTARMYKLIDGVLEYSRAATKPVPADTLDANALVLDVIDALAIPEEIEVEVEALPTVEYPRVQLAQVFHNLIDNAVKYMGSATGKIQITGKTVRDHVEFRIEDTGVGIAPEHHERIFRIFQTLGTRSNEQVGGLGLAIVQKIVERNGGRIYLESRPGVGTTVTFTVPTASDPGEDDKAQDSTA